jgi:hypothetical protein
VSTGSRSATIDTHRIGSSFPADVYGVLHTCGMAAKKKVSRLALFRALIPLDFPPIRAAK